MTKDYKEAISRYILYTRRMSITPQLSAFISMNEGLVISDIIAHKRTSVEGIERMWIRRFTSEVKDDVTIVDSLEVNWIDLLAEGVKQAKENMIQSLKSKRIFALLEGYEKEDDSIAKSVAGPQVEGSANKKKKGKETAHYVQEATESNTTQPKHFGSNVQSIDSSSVDTTSKSSVQSNDVSAQSTPFLQIIYSDNDIDSSYKEKESETMTNVSSAWCIVGYVWSMTLSELNIISEGKKEMVTSNSNIKSIYDNTHNLAFEKLLKPSDIEKRLLLSALFETSHPNNPANRQYIVPLKKLPKNIIQCVRAMEQAIENRTVINLQGIPLNTVNEVALYHILVGIYLNHSKPTKWPSSEIDLIAKSVSELLCSLWSPHNDITVSWDFSTWINKQKMPDSISTRPDLVFCSGLCEVGNGEIKPVGTSKSCVDLARARVLETCKRQLHVRLKNALLPIEAVTFGLLVYGLCYETFVVSFSDGYYPYERVSVGLLPTSFNSYKNAEKTLMDLIQLKESMSMSLSTEITSEEFILVKKDLLIPTVSYSSIVKYNN